MQNKTIVLVLCGILFLGAAWWFFAPKSDNLNEGKTNEPSGERNVDESNGIFDGTLSDLLDANNPVKCIAEVTLEGATHTQTIYSDGQNLRTEMLMTIEGVKNNIYAVVKDGWQYAWMESDMPGAMTMGTKIKIENVDTADMEEFSQENQTIDMNQTMRFSCDPWQVDQSKFDLPADIEFQDISQMMQSITGEEGMDSQDPCAICEMMPSEDLKIQCQAGCSE